MMMHAREPDATSSAETLSAIYDQALPEVYRYLRRRAGSAAVAEELTSSTFVDAALSWSRGEAPRITIAWLITVARNKLIDHWRRQSVAQRSLETLGHGRVDDDPWDTVLDQAVAHATLHRLEPRLRSVLVLRYLDDLTVEQCAHELALPLRTTERLLAHARSEFRTAYETNGGTS